MSRSIEAVYEDGVLRPLEPLALAEHSTVTLHIDSASEEEDGIDWAYVAYCKKLLAENPQILSLEETRAMLRDVKGSFAEALAEERDRH